MTLVLLKCDLGALVMSSLELYNILCTTLHKTPFPRQALQFVEKNAADFGITRVKWLPVSGAFHTPLMRSAKKPLQEVLQSVTIEPPIISVHSNVTSHRYNRPASIVKLLTEQLTSPVKWEQTLHVLYSRPQGEDFPTTYEMGPGRQLGPLLKRTNEKAFEHYTNITS